MRIFIFALVLLPISVLAEGGLPEKPYFYVEGVAEIQKAADIATLQFDLVAHNPDQAKANEEVQGKATKAFALLNSKKIAEKDVIAENLKSEPEYEQDENYSQKRGKLIGYMVTRSFSVKVREVSTFPGLIDELIGVAGAQFSGVEGALSNEKEMQDQLWEKALTNARERAEKTLQSMGMKVDSVFAVSSVAFPEIITRLFATEVIAGVRSAKLPAAQAVSTREYRLAPITMNQSAHIIYLISPAK